VSLERVFKALMSLGLSGREAEVYVYLATKGPQEAANIAENLKLNEKQELTSNLKSLQDRRIVIATVESSIRFRTLPFEKTLAILVETKRKEAQTIEQNREKILSDLHLMIRRNSAK
jgi:sugar-specific transcriptional regulator TrmB